MRQITQKRGKEMGSRGFGIAFAMIAGAVFIVFTGCATGGGDISNYPEGYMNGDIVHGAQLYDKWYTVKSVDLSGHHPLYPAEGKKKGDATWRCKECHGWDYIGKHGRYRTGSHFTGIKGVYDCSARTPDELYRSLTDAGRKHDFSPYLNDFDLWSLVKFIRGGLIDVNMVVNGDGSVNGGHAAGRFLYTDLCSSCHGNDGGEIDFKETKGLQGVGWLAKDNPQETLHKIRWGHPGSKMPSAVVDKGLSDSDSADILAYCQTLEY
jgi:thiosulfate dehydrogenase